MSFIVLHAYLKLIHFDFYLARGNFAALHEHVRKYPVQTRSLEKRWSVRQICAAVDIASALYWKEVLCLQRSAATACLLKNYGVPARMVVGVQHIPFKAHAWVEVNGSVVNDKKYMGEIYAVLDRC